ncbi:carboxylesterase 9 [Tripterygium wilfordii]|uniref:Carboxylesterase 9 n=1 Tax=Tripterygium wilfordii TaxID=458696 RepID=A0A7J7CFS9_TRIWF|nr:probable carboxylesterase 9 [Tripterygium wilfordii]KAF5732983.1 carboxylesterase 9 [Tripterygium wilfordii]
MSDSESGFCPYRHFNIAPNPDGTLTRFTQFPTVQANPHGAPGDSVVSKDVTIDRDKNLWARIYRPTKLPSNDSIVARLPTIIYFKGGAFVFLSAADKTVHNMCSQLTSEVPAIVVSISYRLAPECRLPGQYEDAVDGILWTKQQFVDPEGDEWLRDFGDCSRCYLAGRGSGGNVVFNVAVRALDLDLKPLKICGLIMNQPMFGGNQRTGSELRFATDQLLPLPVQDLMWDLALPLTTNRDHRYCNPMVDGPHKEKFRLLQRCLLIGFGGDPRIDRMQEFVEMLADCGVAVDAQFDEFGFHNIDNVDDGWRSAILNAIREFIY